MRPSMHLCRACRRQIPGLHVAVIFWLLEYGQRSSQSSEWTQQRDCSQNPAGRAALGNAYIYIYVTYIIGSASQVAALFVKMLPATQLCRPHRKPVGSFAPTSSCRGFCYMPRQACVKDAFPREGHGVRVLCLLPVASPSSKFKRSRFYRFRVQERERKDRGRERERD